MKNTKTFTRPSEAICHQGQCVTITRIGKRVAVHVEIGGGWHLKRRAATLAQVAGEGFNLACPSVRKVCKYLLA